MDDPTTSLPFKFDDCDAFLATLDDGNTAKQHHQFQQQSAFPQMTDFASDAATLAGTDMWSMNQPLPPQLSNGAISQPYMMNQVNLEQSQFMVQPTSFYSGGADSSNSSPMPSPSMSINSMSDSDNTGGYIPGSLMYPSNPQPISTATEVQPLQFSTNVSLDPVANDPSLLPVTPPYPSAATDSSSGEGGTSPEEDYTFNDSTYQSFSNQDPSIKNELDDKVDRKGKQPKKLSSQKLNNDSKSNKVTKPKKEKTSHNMIEKRYRTNINDKILALRDCVPSLRCVVTGGPRPAEDLEGLTPASKLNKATVLTKATEYIMHLQKRNQMLLKELNDIRHGRPMEMPMMMDMSGVSQPMAAYPQGHPGMAVQNNGYASKAMMMSMAGLMGASLIPDGSDMQGLSALPFFSFLSTASIGPWNLQSLLFAFKFALVIGTVLYLVAPSLFDSAPQAKVLDHSVEGSLNQYSLREIRRQTWQTNIRSFDLPSESISSQFFCFFTNLTQALIINLMGTEAYEMIARVFDEDQLSTKRTALSRAIDAQLCGGDGGSASRGRLLYTFVKSFILPATPSRYLTQSLHASILCHDNYFFELVGSRLSRCLWCKARNGAADITEESEDDDMAIPKHVRALLDVPGEATACSEIQQRLYNIAHGLPVSEGCLTGEDDEGYLSVVSDKSIRTIVDIVAALYANSLLHEVLVGVLESGEVDSTSLELCAKISPPRSIVARRVAITQALLLGPKDATYVKHAMDMLKDELNQQEWVSHDLVMNTTNSAGARSRSDSHATPSSPATIQPVVLEDSEDDITVSSDSSSIMSDESIQSESDSESISTERGEDTTFLSSALKTSTTPFAVSQDSRLGIRCSLIACFLARGLTAPAFTLMQKVEINKLENVGLLGFVAMWKVLCDMHEHKYSVNRQKLEDLSAVARVWLGGNTGTQEGLSLERLRQLVGESVKMSKFFGGYECELDEGYATQ